MGVYILCSIGQFYNRFKKQLMPLKWPILIGLFIIFSKISIVYTRVSQPLYYGDTLLKCSYFVRRIIPINFCKYNVKKVCKLILVLPATCLNLPGDTPVEKYWFIWW
jgi:hypothetical protein